MSTTYDPLLLRDQIKATIREADQLAAEGRIHTAYETLKGFLARTIEDINTYEAAWDEEVFTTPYLDSDT